MFRHVCVIIRELFRACCVTCESNTMADKTSLYVVMWRIRFACNSAGTEELSDDGTHVSKHVGAAE
jgi:hypothetical protein